MKAGGKSRRWFARLLALALVTLSIPWLAAVGPASGAGALSVQVVSVTQPVTNLSASQTPATAACTGGTVLVGGGIRAFFATGDQIVPGSVYEPINGLVLKGMGPSDAGGSPAAPGADPAFWTAIGGFAGQSEAGDVVSAFAMCATGGPTHTQVVSATVTGPTVNATDAPATATCPGGMILVGGGAMTNNPSPAATPSLKPVGSYPSDAAGSITTATNPTSWTAVGAAGGRGDPLTTTTAYALCSTGATFSTTVVRSDLTGHPAGAGNANPGQDPVATATATCPVGTVLLDGGVLADSSAAGGLQQGVHVRGSYPSDTSANPASSGATNPNSWSAIVQSGGQATPGTNTHAFALCAQAFTTPVSGADLALTKSGPVTASVGAVVTYTLAVVNNGPLPATGVVVTDTLPAGVAFASARSSQGTCLSATGSVSCRVGSLAGGVAITVTVEVTATVAGNQTDSAKVSANEADPNLANNTASATTAVGGATTTVTSSAPVFTQDSPPPTSTVGVPYTYTFVASGSPSPTYTVTSGTLPRGLTLAATTGVLSGTPTTPGTVIFTVAAASGVTPTAVTPLLTITTGPAGSSTTTTSVSGTTAITTTGAATVSATSSSVTDVGALPVTGASSGTLAGLLVALALILVGSLMQVPRRRRFLPGLVCLPQPVVGRARPRPPLSPPGAPRP